MPISNAHGKPVTAVNPSAVEMLDSTISAYLGFRKDTGDRLKEALIAEPDLMHGALSARVFMMLFGQRAIVPRAERSLAAAEKAAGGVTPREAAHLAPRIAWGAGDMTSATARWDAIAGEWPRDVLALKLAQYGNSSAATSPHGAATAAPSGGSAATCIWSDRRSRSSTGSKKLLAAGCDGVQVNFRLSAFGARGPAAERQAGLRNKAWDKARCLQGTGKRAHR